jgi:hypothetical protein
MSDREPESGHSTRLLRALIWSSIGLAPVAALVVLVGGGDGPERVAVLLVTVCVVLLGASLLIRNDPVLLRMHVEDRLADQVGALREELRGEVANPPIGAAGPSVGAAGPSVGAAGPSVGVAGPSVGAASVPEPPIGAARARTVHQVGGATVPGQRAHRTAGARTAMAPVYGRRLADGEQSGRRRADVTAVDIGYTGRRAKGDHAANEDHPSGGPDLDDGEFGYRDPRRSGSEYRGSSYGRRVTGREGHGDSGDPDAAGDPGPRYPASRYGSYGESGFGDPEPGYPGWAEAEERYGSNYGTDRTTGW